MPAAIKLFQLLQKFYKFLGLDIGSNSQCSLNLKNVFIFTSAAQLFISSTAFSLFKAQTVDDYSLSFFISITTFFATINFVVIAWEMANILRLIGKYEEFIGKSELRFKLKLVKNLFFFSASESFLIILNCSEYSKQDRNSAHHRWPFIKKCMKISN